MEYRIVKPISIYNLIVAGAGEEFVSEFERNLCLRATEILSNPEDVSRLLQWTEIGGHGKWFVREGFMIEVPGMAYRAGDRFDITLSGPDVGAPKRWVARDNVDKVMLTDTDGVAKIVSLRTGIVVDISYKYDPDGCITEHRLSLMVKAGYGGLSFARKEMKNGI